MPRQSLLRTVKRWRRYQPRAKWSVIPKETRGVYVLYRRGPNDSSLVTYIGVGGIGRTGGGGIRSRLASHDRKKQNWTHFSAFEVHDNVTGEDIRELEALLLAIFQDDPRIQLINKLKGSKKLRDLRKAEHWNS